MTCNFKGSIIHVSTTVSVSQCSGTAALPNLSWLSMNKTRTFQPQDCIITQLNHLCLSPPCQGEFQHQTQQKYIAAHQSHNPKQSEWFALLDHSYTAASNCIISLHLHCSSSKGLNKGILCSSPQASLVQVHPCR